MQEPSAADGQAIVRQIERDAWRYTVLRALVSVGCPEQLRDGPRTIADLAERCGAHPITLHRMLRAVAQTGLVRSVPPDSYELTMAGRALLEGRAEKTLKYNTDPEIWGAFGELTETVRTGEAPFMLRHGNTYSYLSDKPELAAAFDQLMQANLAPLAASLIQSGVFSGTGTVVDVGGGNGTFLAEILLANPGLRGILLDLERVIPAARQYLTGKGLADRCEFVEGDFFTTMPVGGDEYFVAHVLHNWDDERAAAILRKIRAAIPGHGRLFILEQPLPDDDRPHYGKDLDIRMLTLHRGRERSNAEYAALLAGTGFKPGETIALHRDECLLTATPA
ncbi:MAG: methyltransferase [Streptosporangiaceae bacterium]|jgi:DNA-binding HxlR family transcriptional regulator